MTTKKHSAVSGPVWIVTFIGFAFVAISYFVGLLSSNTDRLWWVYAGMIFGLTLVVLALPVQFLYDLRYDRFSDSKMQRGKYDRSHH